MAKATIEGLAFPSHLGGGMRRSPFQRSLRILVAPCLPFSDAYQRPATKGAPPLGFPNDVASPRRCPSREPGLAGRRGNGVKNLIGSEAIPDKIFREAIENRREPLYSIFQGKEKQAHSYSF
jgi:hypothetical protein